MNSQPTIRYELQLTDTADSTGYFTAVPADSMSFPEAVAYLRAHPLDDFMHKYILGFVNTWSQDQLAAALEDLVPDDDTIRALVLEAALLNPGFGPLLARFSPKDIERLAGRSPLIYIRHFRNPHRQLHREWIARLGENIQQLRPLRSPGALDLDVGPFDAALPDPDPKTETLGSSFRQTASTATRFVPDPEAARQTYRRALEKLESTGVVEGAEMRHTASLSPVALLRKWRFSVTVRHRALHYRFSGGQTSYGRGLDLDSARAACAMEMIERVSSFVSVDRNILPELKVRPALQYGSRADLLQDGHHAVDPQQLGLETDYAGQDLAWMPGCDSEGAPVYVPLQSVFLFANYDEPALYTGLGSTGLASGSSQAQARLSAMLEIIERDADGTTPYDTARCFRLTSEDAGLAPLLADLRERDIYPWFQDITPEFGVPAYRCLVQGSDGAVYRGTCAHPDGKKAVISALTETPYPYPEGPPTQKPPENLPVLDCDALPCLSSGNIKQDYGMLKSVLCSNGFEPVFLDLTRADLDTPVARAVIPGMEILADFDDFSRVHPRLFTQYLRAANSL